MSIALPGCGGQWKPEPGKIRVTSDVCQEKLSAEESDIRPFSDDQNIIIGYVSKGPALPLQPRATETTFLQQQRVSLYLRPKANRDGLLCSLHILQDDTVDFPDLCGLIF
jgi:hypothetical protein